MGILTPKHSKQLKMPLHNKLTIFLLLTLSFTSAAPGAGPCNGDGSLEPQCDGRRLYFPHEFDCSKFWECGPTRKPCLFQCPPISEDLGGGTLLFNTKAQTCDWPEYVNCPEPQTTTELIHNSTTTYSTTDTATTDVITTDAAAQTTQNATTIHTAATTTATATNTIVVTTSSTSRPSTANPVTKSTTFIDATSTSTSNDATTNTPKHTTTTAAVTNHRIKSEIVLPTK